MKCNKYAQKHQRLDKS